ncbi:MAG: type II toxin-antitoxin system VapC family toxin [Rubrivivax sp.]|jgi:predicted nucleic acid-binding protein
MVMPDEARPSTLWAVMDARLFAPAIWPVEVANALRNGVRRGRLLETDVQAVCEHVEAFEVETSPTSDLGVRQRYLSAHAHDLTAYDAAYLELALQRRCALATLDNQLALAARRAGVAVLD